MDVSGTFHQRLTLSRHPAWERADVSPGEELEALLGTVDHSWISGTLVEDLVLARIS